LFDEIRILCIDDDKRKELLKMVNELGDDIKGKVKVELLKDYFVAL
jgi:hypothetical protein